MDELLYTPPITINKIKLPILKIQIIDWKMWMPNRKEHKNFKIVSISSPIKSNLIYIDHYKKRFKSKIILERGLKPQKKCGRFFKKNSKRGRFFIKILRGRGIAKHNKFTGG